MRAAAERYAWDRIVPRLLAKIRSLAL